MWNYENDASWSVSCMLVCVCIFSSCQSLFLSIFFCFDAMKMSKYSLIYVQSFCLSWSFFAYVVYFLCGPIFQLCGLFAMWSICDFLIFLASIFNFIYNFCYVICEFVLCVTSVLCNSSFNMVISLRGYWEAYPVFFCFMNMEAAL